MPKKVTKFVSEYLIPNLDSQRFGNHLKWIDKKKSKFELDWCHKGGPTWSKEEAEVFVEWDKIKGHYQPEDKQYYTKSKQRFRSLLYKLTVEGQIKKLKSDDKFKKIYSINEKKLKTKRNHSDESNAEYNFDNTDEKEDGDMCSDEIHCSKASQNNFIRNELADHNYSSPSKSSYTYSDCEDRTVPELLYKLPENFEKKLLMIQNYSNSFYMNILATKDMNNLNGNLEDVLFDEDLQTDAKNATYTKTEVKALSDFAYELNNYGCMQKTLDENEIPTEIAETHPQPIELFDKAYFNFDDIFNDSNTENIYFKL